MATSFSGRRRRSTRREPPTMGTQLVNLITCDCKLNAPFLVHLCELLPSLVVRLNFFKNLLLWNHWANLNQTWPESSLGGFPLKVMSNSHAPHPRWPPLLKIEISSNGQNCFILSQNVPKFELYKHNDELFNIYYGNFYERWAFVDFDRLCKLEKRGNEIK